MNNRNHAEYEAGCICPLHPCPIHDTPNEELLKKQFPFSHLSFLPKLDDAIVGICRERQIICYDEARVMELLTYVYGMTYADADAWLKQQHGFCLVTMVD